MLQTYELETFADRVLSSGQAGDFLALLFPKARTAIRIPDQILGPLRIRCMKLLDAGSWIQGHTHNYGHDTVIHEGSALLEYYLCGPDKLPLTPGVPSKWMILGGKGRAKSAYIDPYTWHKFTALEPGTDLRCYYVHRDIFGKVVPEYNGVEESYV